MVLLRKLYDVWCLGAKKRIEKVRFIYICIYDKLINLRLEN